MKIKPKKKTKSAFGDMVAVAYQNWGNHQVANIVPFTIKTRWVVSDKQPVFMISSTQGTTV